MVSFIYCLDFLILNLFIYGKTVNTVLQERGLKDTPAQQTVMADLNVIESVIPFVEHCMAETELSLQIIPVNRGDPSLSYLILYPIRMDANLIVICAYLLQQ